MATRTRDGVPAAKEKRVISPSQPPRTTSTTSRRLSLHPSRATTSSLPPSQSPRTTTTSHRLSLNSPKAVPGERHHLSTAAEKHVPNYLRPTRSSAQDVPKQVSKRQVSDATAHKPNLTRTRSMDKPPLARTNSLDAHSHTQILRISPTRILRSSSFSGRSTTRKPALDKSMKVGGRPCPSPNTRSVTTLRRSNSNIMREETDHGAADIKGQASSPASNISVVQKHETEIESRESSPPVTTEEESLIDAGVNNEQGAEILGLEDKEVVTVEEAEPESHSKECPSTEPSAVSQQNDISYQMKTEESREKLWINGTGSQLQELEGGSVNENNNSGTADSTPTKVEEEEAENKESPDKKEVVDIGGIQTTDYEKKAAAEQEIGEEVKQEAEQMSPRQQRSIQGRRDPALSNDVIEETASKLREQRKNKVKALAGAFETVISMQESK